MSQKARSRARITLPLLIIALIGAMLPLLSTRSASAATSHPDIKPHSEIFGGSPDCEWPTVEISIVYPFGGQHVPSVHGEGDLVCHKKPDHLTSFMTLLMKVSRPHVHWVLIKVGHTIEGLRFIHPGRWTRRIKLPPHGCLTATVRANWVSHGISSTGDPDEGSFCSPPLRIANCAAGPSGNSRHRASDQIKCPNPLVS